MLAHTIECMWERKISMFPVLDTNLWCKVGSLNSQLKGFFFSWTDVTCLFNNCLFAKLVHKKSHLKGFFTSWYNAKFFCQLIFSSKVGLQLKCIALIWICLLLKLIKVGYTKVTFERFFFLSWTDATCFFKNCLCSKFGKITFDKWICLRIP